jgi:DNA-binding MarR family transcriptional regulator
MGSQRTRPRGDHDADRRAILDAIRQIVRALRLSARDAENRVGLSAAQLFVLHRLAEGGTLSLGELAQRTLTDPSSVSVVVTRLLERGLVSRERASSDARRAEIALTASGRRLVKRSPSVAQETLIAALDRVQPERRRTLARLLGELVQAMGASEEPAPLFFENEPRRRQGARHVRRTR